MRALLSSFLIIVRDVGLEFFPLVLDEILGVLFDTFTTDGRNPDQDC